MSCGGGGGGHCPQRGVIVLLEGNIPGGHDCPRGWGWGEFSHNLSRGLLSLGVVFRGGGVIVLEPSKALAAAECVAILSIILFK